MVAFRKRLPFEFRRIPLHFNIGAAEKPRFTRFQEADTKLANLGKTKDHGPLVAYGLAHAPEEADLALVRIMTINGSFSHWDEPSCMRPGESTVI